MILKLNTKDSSYGFSTYNKIKSLADSPILIFYECVKFIRHEYLSVNELYHLNRFLIFCCNIKRKTSRSLTFLPNVYSIIVYIL